jgi:hypothetical protein
MPWIIIAALSVGGPSGQYAPPPPPPWWGGRMYTAPNLHVGIRPGVFLDNADVGYAYTLQITTDWPWYAPPRGR